MTTTRKSAAAPEAPADALKRRTFQLAAPIHVGDGTITSHTCTEPLQRQLAASERNAAKYGGNFALALLLEISDLPEAAARQMKLRDLGAVRRWFGDLTRAALVADGLGPQADADDEPADPFAADGGAAARDSDPLETERTFTLLVPRIISGKSLTEITVQEPDLEAATAATKFKNNAEQTAAMLAVMSGTTIPTIGALAARDVARLEAWMAPFVRDLQGVATG